MFNVIKKLVYIWLLAYLAFVVISVFSGGSVVREIGEKFRIPYFDKLAEEGDALKRKADSFFRSTNGKKQKEEEKIY